LFKLLNFIPHARFQNIHKRNSNSLTQHDNAQQQVSTQTINPSKILSRYLMTYDAHNSLSIASENLKYRKVKSIIATNFIKSPIWSAEELFDTVKARHPII
jgi:hypothetical protein